MVEIRRVVPRGSAEQEEILANIAERGKTQSERLADWSASLVESAIADTRDTSRTVKLKLHYGQSDGLLWQRSEESSTAINLQRGMQSPHLLTLDDGELPNRNGDALFKVRSAIAKGFDGLQLTQTLSFDIEFFFHRCALTGICYSFSRPFLIKK